MINIYNMTRYDKKKQKYIQKNVEKGNNMKKKEKEMLKVLEKIDVDLSKKEQAYILGFIEGLIISRTI